MGLLVNIYIYNILTIIKSFLGSFLEVILARDKANEGQKQRKYQRPQHIKP